MGRWMEGARRRAMDRDMEGLDTDTEDQAMVLRLTALPQEVLGEVHLAGLRGIFGSRLVSKRTTSWDDSEARRKSK